MKLPRLLILAVIAITPFLINSQITVHNEDFASGIGAWTQVDITDPTDIWTATSGYMEVNGYGGSDDEDWLISPAINMDAQEDEYFMFDYNDLYVGGLIELYYSTDYAGTGSPASVAAATWNNIPLEVLDINGTSCFSTLFQRHPAIDISTVNGTSVYFAFKYTGLSGSAKRYRIDNVRIEAEYYSGIETAIQLGINCQALKTEIFNQIKQADVIYYTSSSYDVWDSYLHTDTRLNDAGNATIVWDMFTDYPTTTGEFEFDHCSNRDNGSCPGGEGNCYNREHSLPKSWWGGGTTYPTDTMYTDLHHLVPSDREMNSAKLNYPPGEVITATTTGTNGFKVGTNPSYPCSSMQYFEPIDTYKGDYARMYFYMATRYESQIASWETLNATGDCALSGDSYTPFEPWLMDLLLQWHAADPVSQKEIDRNNAVYSIQGNRNPFIDNPQYIGYIWGDALGNSCSQLSPSPCSPTSGSESVSACGSYTWNGTTYSTSGTYTVTLTNAAGCDSIATLNLTINQPTSGSESVSACGSYTWNGTTYSTSGTYTATLTNAAGCDSTATLNLTIGQPTSGSESISACGSYTWNGTTYSTSGTYTATLTNAAGCDSTATLNLTIGQPTSGGESVSACGSYTWNGTTYSTSGTYTATLTNAAGCDSTATLNLTIGQPTSGSESVSVCGSYTWNGTTYSTSGTYTATLTNASGCDSTATLNLTVGQPTSGSETVSACGSYTWNGTTYSTSGTYTGTLTNAAGCDSIATLYLTINQPTSGGETVSACGSYTWNGTTYSTSGTYTATLTNAAGCDSTATLNLTVGQPTSGGESVSACGSYSWNGTTYFTSGTYTATLTNAAGCDSTATLNLTIGQPTSGGESVSACGSYTWNGTTYSTSGTYTATLTNAAGCDSIATLNLTIDQPTSGGETVSACGSYTWNGTTYSTSGTYTATLTNAAGCDSTATLNLTINQPTSGGETVSACGSYTWNGTTYSTSGTYTATLTNAAGCDSIATLNLTISSIDNTVTQTNELLESNMIGANYQWLDCDNGFSPIAGETNQSFTATVNGNYAVIVELNGCTDTSDCHLVSTIGIDELNSSLIEFAPNPTSGKVVLHLDGKVDFIDIQIYDALGQIVSQYDQLKTGDQFQVDGESGYYLVKLFYEEKFIGTKRIVKQ